MINVLENSKIVTNQKDLELIQKIKGYLMKPDCIFTKIADPIEEIISVK
jgi:hypothetical protein